MKRDYTLRRVALVVCLLALALGNLPFGFSQQADGTRMRRQNFSPYKSAPGGGRTVRRQSRAAQARKFARTRALLLTQGVPFEPNELLEPNWRQNLKGHFYRMPEMKSQRRVTSGRLNGVYMADTLILPEKMKADGDIFILARRLIYDGEVVEISAPGRNVSVFIIESSEFVPRTPRAPGAQPSAPTVVVNTGALPEGACLEARAPSSTRRGGRGGFIPAVWSKESGPFLIGAASLQGGSCTGSNGSNGSNGGNGIGVGTNGSHGSLGADGTCGTLQSQRNGANGTNGANGGAGDNGFPGSNGGSGNSAGSCYWEIPSSASGSYFFTATGGNGGNGGSGGHGANGGRGGSGGGGGNGATCSDCDLGSGNGGNGGNGGDAGRGGNGGTGGHGGNGGSGGAITVINYSCNVSVTATSIGGFGGSGGSGGTGGSRGLAGNEGLGGDKGVTSCPNIFPTDGSNGTPGADNSGLDGSTGQSGNNGQSGSAIQPYVEEACGGGGSSCAGEGTSCTQQQCEDCDEMDGFLDPETCQCWTATPVIIDLGGDGISLTDWPGGVQFDINADALNEHIAWTAPGSDDAFLALDRNNNGTIDDGSELFGNHTPQPPSAQPQGFLALAEFDKPANGGNADGRISSSDAVFARLRLWVDANHNGLSEPEELRGLAAGDISSVETKFHVSKRRDQYNNLFRYRAKVRDARGADVGRWAWDVLLVGTR